MVEQLAPQGWSPVDNIPSLIPCVSVFHAAPQLMSLNLLLSVSLRSWKILLYSDSFLSHVRPPTTSIPTQNTNRKANSKNGDDEGREARVSRPKHRLSFLVSDFAFFRRRQRKGHGKEQVQSQNLRSLNVNILAQGEGRCVSLFFPSFCCCC
jgi:hypothetical protein